MHIETQRLIIRDFTLADWEDVHRYASNPEVVEYMIWGPNSEEETKDYINQTLSMQQQDPRKGFELAVILKESNTLIGGCGFHIEVMNAEVGYCFNPDFWGKGYATEATTALLKFGFKETGVNRIYATCRPGNSRSANVMKRVGMKQEGHLREHMWHKGKFHDSYLFSILKSEFTG